MPNKTYKIAGLLLTVVLIAGAFWIWQKNKIEKESVQEKAGEEMLGNSQKASDKYNQLLVRVTGPGEEGDGDIITIGGETHEWGRMEKIKFLIVTIPALSQEEKTEFAKEEDGKKIYRVAYEKFLSAEEIVKIKAQKEGLEKPVLIGKGDIVKR
jgi:hypothetical protein